MIRQLTYSERPTDLTTWEPRYNEPLYNEVLGTTNDFLYPRNSKIYEKELLYNDTSLQRTRFASPLAFRYIEVPLDMDLDIGKFNPHYGRLVGNLSMKRMGLKIFIIITTIMIIRLISIFLSFRFYRVSEFDVILNRLLVEITTL